MLCENCNERDATFHLQQNLNGKKTQAHLCQPCATELGYTGSNAVFGGFGVFGTDNDASGPMDINTLWSQLFGIHPQEWNQLFQMNPSPFAGLATGDSSQINEESTVPQAVACKTCGMTMQSFASSSLLGCPDCYTSFKPQLDALLKRIQAGNRHVGRQPNAQTVTNDIDNNAEEEASEKDHETTEVEALKEQLWKKTTADNEVETETENWQQAIQRLKEEQDEAVMLEDYEQAAIIRDKIRAMQEEVGDGNG